jgi:hypothetical protein
MINFDIIKKWFLRNSYRVPVLLLDYFCSLSSRNRIPLSAIFLQLAFWMKQVHMQKRGPSCETTFV